MSKVVLAEGAATRAVVELASSTAAAGMPGDAEREMEERALSSSLQFSQRGHADTRFRDEHTELTCATNDASWSTRVLAEIIKV